MSLSAGDRLGSHEILGLLGAGGMGEVYLAQDTRLNRRVAIKVLPEAYASDPDRVARFHREAQAVAALNHTSIAAIYDLAEADGIKYLVLELIEGDTLADRLRRGPIPVDEALQIAKQILEALEAAHEKGICHRDLKPANIKLTADGGVKVLDFGLAKFLQGGTTAANLTHSPTLSLAGTYPGLILGTAGYMSPEQAKGFEADQRSDLFSFGCILFEMLTGRQAFEGETASEILASVLKIDVDLTTLPPRLNPRLVDVLRRCLEKNPKKRWHAAADVRNEIEAVMGRASIVEEARPGPVAARPLWKRALSAAAFVAIGAVAGYAAWALRPQPAKPVMRFTVALPEGQIFSNLARRSIALSPDGQNLAYVANARIYLRSLSTLEARLIAGTENSGSVTNPTFSPDGQSIVFTAPSSGGVTGSLKRVALSGGAAVTLSEQFTAPHGLTWDEHGIMMGQTDKGILRVPPTGGTGEVLAAIETGEMASSPQMLPDGRSLLFTIKKSAESWDKGRIVVQRLGTSERTTLIEGGSDARYVPTGHLVYGHAGVIFAVAFDPDTLAVKGGPVPVIEGVRRAWSPSSSGSAHLAFSSSSGALAYVPGPATTEALNADLAVFDRKGSPDPLKMPTGTYRAPRVSPDGKWVVFESEDETQATVSVYELGGATAIRRLTFGGRNRAPIWSPDGEWIAYQSDREGDLAIFRQRADGSGTPERLTKAGAGEEHIPQSWSPDGATLLFTLRKNQEHTLWSLPLKDARPTPFGDVRSGGLVEAAFSPDGRWVAYQQRDGGAGNVVFVEPFPRTGAKYQVPHENPGHPHWSRKGDELILNAGPTRSIVIGVTTAPRFAFGRPTDIGRIGRQEPNPTLTRRNVDSLPDGRLLGVLTPSVSGGQPFASQITVVINWFDELRQRVPVR